MVGGRLQTPTLTIADLTNTMTITLVFSTHSSGGDNNWNNYRYHDNYNYSYNKQQGGLTIVVLFSTQQQ